MSEEWVNLEYIGYPDYKISNNGNVKRVLKTGKDKLIKPRNNGNEQIIITLYKDTIKRAFVLKTLVAKTFVPNLEDFKCVVHLDGDKTNFKHTNLAWIKREVSEAEKEKLSMLYKGKTISKEVLNKRKEQNNYNFKAMLLDVFSNGEKYGKNNLTEDKTKIIEELFLKYS